ncbi:MAG: glycine--tRNA ligase subunit beta, partial [Fimbriimonadaceae bacterium]|nr:glycine--tRNA ligase subunit beta [Fimbriimonadaceae bacterium]
SNALLGFCRGQGVAVDQVRVEGDYVWISQEIKGKDMISLLAEILPEAVTSLAFDKTMRWGQGRMRFARPIRWILASFAGNTVPFELEGVKSGNESRGHRFYHPDIFCAENFNELIEGLRARKVEADPAKREEMIREGARQVASGDPQLSDSLVDENVFLTEWPIAIEGTFPETYQSLPEEVLITAMVKHERFFPVRDQGGRLLNRFISIRNAGEDDSVRAGNEWVLNARFNDAKFFYDEDLRFKLDEFLARTEKMTFQEKLGTVRERANRLSRLAESFAPHFGADPALAAQVGLYAKADLSSGLVSELASLQGIVGGHYAARAGFAPEVCQAIAFQYDPRKAEHHPLAASLLVSDQWDKLAGFLGIGLVPSGTSDPFGLRRAATQIIEVSWANNHRAIDHSEFWKLALEGVKDFGTDRVKATEALLDLFRARYQALLNERRFDCLDAVLAAAKNEGFLLQPTRIKFALSVCERVANQAQFIEAASRPINILAAARKKDLSPDSKAILDEGSVTDSAKALLDNVKKTELILAKSSSGSEESVEEVAEVLISLRQPIHDFFESTMVMAEDPATRDFNLNLLAKVEKTLSQIGDFSKIVVPG